jgi:GH43 family beta-xylosidase
MEDSIMRYQFLCFAAILFAVSQAFSLWAQCSGPFYPNPLTAFDRADPGILRVGNTIYTYHTSGCSSSGVYPIRSSGITDRLTWTNRGTVFSPSRYPAWSTGCNFWAPEVHFVQNRYVCYFTTRRASTGKMCIGAATSSSPTGPFTDIGAPLISETVDLIDPTFFKDPVSGKSFVIFKKPSGLYVTESLANGTTLVGPQHFLLQRDTPWEGPNVEAPSVVYRNGFYYLFYSGNVYTSESYGVGVARSGSVTGPYQKSSANPIMASNDHFGGPGHQFLFEESPGTWTMFYHARNNATGSVARLLMSDPVAWDENGWPSAGEGTPSESWGGCDYILDNSSSAFTASANWSTGTSAADKYGPDYRFHLTAPLSDLAQWTTSVSPGAYRVSAWWSQGANRSSSAPYTLPNGTVVRVNQQTGGGAWNALATVSLNGAAATKLSCWTSFGNIVVGDAIRYKQVGR